MVLEMGGRLHGGTCPPGGNHLGGDIGKQPRGQPHRPDRQKALGLGDHRVQADVAGVCLDERELGLLGRGFALIGSARDGRQGVEAVGHGTTQAGRDPLRKGLRRHAQGGSHDTLETLRGRWLNALGAAARQQLGEHQLGPALALSDVLGQP